MDELTAWQTLRHGQHDVACLRQLLAQGLEDQSIAIGAVLDRGGHVELYIAESPMNIHDASSAAPGSDALAHLDDICTRLLRVRAGIDASTDPSALREYMTQDPFIDNAAADPCLLPLRDLHAALWAYSAREIRARLEEGRRQRRRAPSYC